MAHFIGYLQGSRGEASRLGTKKSGISATANGWNIGVTCEVSHSMGDDTDYFLVYRTGGSNGHGQSELIYDSRKVKR